MAAAAGLVLGIVGGLARLRPFRVLVEGESMLPLLRPGDQLVAVRPRRIRRGDVVVVRPPGYEVEMVKRVTGLPGETPPETGRRLGPDEYLVVGDNPVGSTDGRVFGPVPREALLGVVRLRYFPRPGRV